jgi:tRNA-binding protein
MSQIVSGGNLQITYSDFEKVEIKVGKIIGVEDLAGARKSAYKLKIDFGSELGIKNSSAQITALYKKEDLLNRQVVCVVNFPSKRIAGFESEVLTLGVPDKDGNVVLLKPDSDVNLGVKVF